MVRNEENAASLRGISAWQRASLLPGGGAGTPSCYTALMNWCSCCGKGRPASQRRCDKCQADLDHAAWARSAMKTVDECQDRHTRAMRRAMEAIDNHLSSDNFTTINVDTGEVKPAYRST